MEETKDKKTVADAQGAGAEQPLSYEELNQNFIDLNIGYQKLLAQYRKLAEDHNHAVEALQARDFDYMSFFLSMLFKVVEHPEMYKDEFVNWATENIQSTLVGFAEGMRESSVAKEEEAPKKESKKQNS